MINVSDDTTGEDCIKNEDETAYKVEVQIMVGWRVHTNLELNVLKIKELIIESTPIRPLSINGVIDDQIPGHNNFKQSQFWHKYTVHQKVQNHWARVAIH